MFDLGLWLFRFCSFQHSTSQLFTYINERVAARSPHDDVLYDIYDGERWDPFYAAYCTEPDTNYIFWALSFDFVSPFAQDNRSNQETKSKKVGLLHLFLLNLPPALRSLPHNVCTAGVLEDEPSHTINGVSAFLVNSLQHLYRSGMTITTSDGKAKFIRAFLYVIYADGPARSKCAGCPHPSGKWPCNDCFGSGIPVLNASAPDGKPLLNYANMQTFSPRSHEEVIEALQTVESKATSKTALATATSVDAKGYRWTPFLSLEYFDAVLSVAWDAMHVWVENVLNFFLSTFVKLYGQSLVDHCNTMLVAIKQASGLLSKIRNSLPSNLLERLGSAKAQEILTFVNVVSEHVFDTYTDFSPDDRIVWKMIVDVSKYVSSYTPRKRQEALYDKLYRTAVRLFSANHPEIVHPPNVHFATHLFSNIRRYGPSWTTWCFANERLMGRVGKLNFSSSRKGLLRTISRSFRTQMFSKPVLESARSCFLSDSALLSHPISTQERIEVGRFLDKADHFLTHPSCGPWDVPSEAMDSIYAIACHNRSLRSMGLASEDLDPRFQILFSSRLSEQFQLPSADNSYPAGSWQSTLIKFLQDNDHLGPLQPNAYCFQKMSFGSIASRDQPSVCALHAPRETWNLGSTYRGPDLWSADACLDGSVVQAEFEVKASGGPRSELEVCSFYGHVLSFVEISLLSGTDKLRLAYVKWRKICSQSAMPTQLKAMSAGMPLVNPVTGRPPPMSAYHSSQKWKSAQDPVLTDKCYATDPWIPINRIMGRVALLPCFNDANRVVAYRVIHIPFA